MSNVLIEDKQQQVIALGRLGWSLRRIERETGVRRGTAGGYLRAAGMAVRPPGAWGRSAAAKPAIGVTTGSEAKPAIEVTTGSEPVLSSPSGTAGSSCEPWRDEIELGLSRGAQCHGHLAGSGGQPGLHRQLPIGQEIGRASGRERR